jgi:hypothetical protein
VVAVGLTLLLELQALVELVVVELALNKAILEQRELLILVAVAVLVVVSLLLVVLAVLVLSSFVIRVLSVVQGEL